MLDVCGECPKRKKMLDVGGRRKIKKKKDLNGHTYKN
jgi:hypothetical protein